MEELILNIAHQIQGLGAWGYPLALALMMGVAILPFPAEIPAMVNGMLFGPVGGVAVTWAGAVLGAMISFELAKRFGRPLVERVLSDRAIAKVDAAVSAAGWPGLIIVRLIPAIAFTALNWGIGLTACSRRRFFWTTAVGILPGTVLFVVSGQGVLRLYRSYPSTTIVVSALALALIVLLALRDRAVEGGSEVRPDRGGSGY